MAPKIVPIFILNLWEIAVGAQESTVGVVAMGQLGLLFFQRVDYCCDIDCQKLKHVIYVCAQGCGSSWSYMLWQSSLTF